MHGELHGDLRRLRTVSGAASRFLVAAGDDGAFPSSLDRPHPWRDEFIGHLLDLDPGAVCNAARQQRQALRNPSKSSREFLDTLLRQGLAGTVARLEEMIDLI